MTQGKIAEEFKIPHLERGRVYKFQARNFSYGVWDGVHGFIGIREKFYSVYLFTEYHWDAGGTVTPLEATEHLLPDGIDPVEMWHLCKVCDKPVTWVRNEDRIEKSDPQGWYVHADRADLDEDHKADRYIKANPELFEFLRLLEPNEEWRESIRLLSDQDEAVRDAEYDRIVSKRKEQRGW